MDRRTFARRIFGISIGPAVVRPLAAAAPTPAAGSRVSTFTHVGKEEQPFLNSRTAQLAFQQGSGFVDHMWFGGAFKDYKNLRLRVYVDGEELPSIDAELGMAAGVGFQDPTAPWGTRWSGITGAPSGIYLNYRIPYSTSMKITAQLPDGVPNDTVFWWIVRGLENHPLQLCGFELPQQARLRLHRLDRFQAQPLQEFDLAQVSGAGLVFQVTIAAKSSNLEYLEGMMRAYIGGASEPQLLSSGLEDYFLGTYYFNRGLYHLPDAGLTHKDEGDGSFSAYRFHTDDPLAFSGGLKLACRCGEKRGNKTFGTTGKPLQTTYTTYAWIYGW